jgi:hypothetical protein
MKVCSSHRFNGKSLNANRQQAMAWTHRSDRPICQGRIELARSRGFGHAAIRNGTHHLGQASILMGVHSVLRELLRSGNICVPGSDRMDNLPRVYAQLGAGMAIGVMAAIFFLAFGNGNLVRTISAKRASSRAIFRWIVPIRVRAERSLLAASQWRLYAVKHL